MRTSTFSISSELISEREPLRTTPSTIIRGLWLPERELAPLILIAGALPGKPEPCTTVTTETNPLYALANENYQDERTRILANINSKYKIDDDFTLGASYSRDIRLTQYESFVDKDWLDTENTTNQNGYIERNQYKNDFMNGNVSLSMNKDINDDLNIKGQISYDYQKHYERFLCFRKQS